MESKSTQQCKKIWQEAPGSRAGSCHHITLLLKCIQLDCCTHKLKQLQYQLLGSVDSTGPTVLRCHDPNGTCVSSEQTHTWHQHNFQQTSTTTKAYPFLTCASLTVETLRTTAVSLQEDSRWSHKVCGRYADARYALTRHSPLSTFTFISIRWLV